MKIIVTHAAPDWDAIGSVWLIKSFLPGWQEAVIKFVPAGTRLAKSLGYHKGTTFSEGSHSAENEKDPIELLGEDEIIHVDTGLGPLDHHQTSDQQVCAATRTWDYVRTENEKSGSPLRKEHQVAISRIIQIILQDDHFREVFWADPLADYHEFSLVGVLEGLKFQKPDQDELYVSFGSTCLDALTHTFESRIWAEKEIAENGIKFELKKKASLPAGRQGIAFETVNDNVIKLAQKMGYVLVIRKDPRKGYVRIKARPASGKDDDIDLTAAYEKLRVVDSKATWFLHVSKKMLLNGTPKNPAMVPTIMTLQEIIDVIKSIY